MDDSFGYWLSGLTDGEGHFGLCDVKSSPRALPIAEFCIKLRDDDRAVLELIQKELQMGRICTVRSTHKDQTKFAINCRGDLLQLVWIFDKYPLKSKKRWDYKIWRQAVIVLNNPLPSKDYLLELARKLKKVREYPSTSIQCPQQSISAQLASFLETCMIYK